MNAYEIRFRALDAARHDLQPRTDYSQGLGGISRMEGRPSPDQVITLAKIYEAFVLGPTISSQTKPKRKARA